MKFFDRSHKVLFFMSAVALFTGAMFYFQQPTAVNNTPQSLAQNTVAVFEQPSSEPTQPILAAATKSPETNEATAQKLPNRLKNHRDLAQKETLAFVEEAEEDAAAETEEKRNVEGRAEAEFKMIKNPKTGKMPHDVHIKSIAAAKKTRALQLPAELNEDGVSLRSLPVIGITPRGPNNYGGRTLGIGIDKRNSMNVLAGGASSGIFRSTNGGASWTRVTPSGDIHSVTAIAQDTRAGQEDTWYCGSGESSIASPDGVGALYYGNGLWKSTDNGVTWVPLASTKSDLYSFDNDFDYIYRIVVNPNNGDVLVSASETIKRSSDGGATWSNVLGSNNRAEKLGKSGDVIYNVASNTFYASIYGSNTAGGIYNSTDGIAWTKIATPTVLGNGPLRIVLANVANTANVLAFYETTTSPCSTNKVALQLYNASMMTWTNYSDKIGVCAAGTSNPKVIKSQGGYNMCIATKPDDANTVYFGGTEIYRLNLATFAYEYIGGDQGTATATNLHVDNHYLTFDPNNNNLLWACNDGGMRTTVVTGTIAAGPTGGFAWTDRTTNYTTHQYYGSDISPINGSTFLAGAAQDNAFTIHPTDATAKEVGPTVDGVTIGMISGTSTADFNAIIDRKSVV